MNILLFNGSHRVNGNTSKLSKSFLDIAVEMGHTVYSLDSIESCIHCSVCTRGLQCPLKDNFEDLEIPIYSLDAVVVASPLYFFSISPKALSFLTRLYPYSLDHITFGLILASGSDFSDSGVDIVVDQFKSIDSYCGSTTVYPYHKVTYDKVWEVSDLDTEGLKQLLTRIESAVKAKEDYRENQKTR